MASTGELPFASRAILLDLSLSYDFDKETTLSINPLEGLLAACVMEGQTLSNEIIELNGKKTFKALLLGGNYGIDKLTRDMIENDVNNKMDFIRLLKTLLDEEDFSFGKPLEGIQNCTYQILARIYLHEVFKFKQMLSNG